MNTVRDNGNDGIFPATTMQLPILIVELAVIMRSQVSYLYSLTFVSPLLQMKKFVQRTEALLQKISVALVTFLGLLYPGQPFITGEGKYGSPTQVIQ